jgi:flagellar hook protein FlgE
MGSALWAGISGLNASSKELDVIANNLANTNTIGFKSGTTYFADVLSQSISGGSSGSMQVGRGVSVSEIQTQFGSGSFETTGVSTDVAIDGDGFFMVNNEDNATLYTRAGAFRMNNAGLLVDTDGNTVQGKQVVNGEPTGALGDISLADVQSSPQVTTSFSIGANLNSDTATGGQYNTTQTVYDSLGATHTLNTTFTRTALSGSGDNSSRWGVQCFMDSDSTGLNGVDGFTFGADGTCTGMYTASTTGVVTASAAGVATAAINNRSMVGQTDTFTLTRNATDTGWNISSTFYPEVRVTSINPNGISPITINLSGTDTTDVTITPTVAFVANETATFSLTNVPVALGDITVSYPTPPASWNGATIGTGGDITWNLLGDGSLNLTQYSTASVIRSLTSDGYASGNLKSLSISADGKISGFFTNGQTSDLDQLMIAQFSNPWGLKKMGGNLFAETVSSGSAIQNYPGQSGMGTLTSNTLEMSNTDIATEFIKMITAQKAYQASAKVVTTENDMMQVLMNIKQ